MKIDPKKLILTLLPILVNVITDIVTGDKKKKK
jgi:hypothetical protein